MVGFSQLRKKDNGLTKNKEPRQSAAYDRISMEPRGFDSVDEVKMLCRKQILLTRTNCVGNCHFGTPSNWDTVKFIRLLCVLAALSELFVLDTFPLFVLLTFRRILPQSAFRYVFI